MMNQDADNIRDNIKIRWAKWLQEDWYAEVVHFLLFRCLLGDVEEGSPNHQDDELQKDTILQRTHADIRRLRKVKLKSKKFALSEADNQRSLMYQEVSGEYAQCIVRGDVARVLYHFHDLHGHFAVGVMNRNLVG